MGTDGNAVALANRQITVLIVDDESLGRAPLVDEFLDLGYRVLEASNADEALDIVRNETAIDVVITDIRMPGSMDGIGLARHLRWRYRRIHVVLMSSSVPQPSARQLADGYFNKPFALSKMREHIQGLLVQTVH